MNKLSHYGIHRSLHQWIFSFLSQRTQRIRVDGELSDGMPVLPEVPQGTVLSPLLLLLGANVDSYKHSFFPKTIRDWDTSTEEQVTSKNAEVFKKRLKATAPYPHGLC